MRIKLVLTFLIFSGIIFSQENTEKLLVDDLVGHWTFNNGECFVNHSGNIGVGDTYYTYYTPYALIANEWYRIGVSVKNGDHYDYYIDGFKSITAKPNSVDGRFSLLKLMSFLEIRKAYSHLLSQKESCLQMERILHCQ